jgi:Zn finger protein HypA/HybF involved in hydrogenase expression
MSGITMPSDNKIILSNLPQQCWCSHCNEVIYAPPYYWKTMEKGNTIRLHTH